MNKLYENAVEQTMKRAVDQSLVEIAGAANAIAASKRSVNNGDNNNSLIALLSADFAEHARDWVEKRMAETVDLAAFALTCYAENLSPSQFVGSKVSRCNKTSKVETVEAAGNGSAKDGASNVKLLGGLEIPKTKRTTTKNDKGIRFGGSLKRGACVRFLLSNGFRRINGGKEDVYSHIASGQNVSVPNGPAGTDIHKNTSAKIRRRVSEILKCDVEIVSGRLEFTNVAA